MRFRPAVGVIALGVVFSAGPAAQANEFTLTIKDGRVTLVAENVPVRQILAEWARVGQTKIVNADKLVGPPVTLTLVDVPEARALETVLRSASGYLAAPRSVPVDGASRYDRIMILATSRPPASSPAPAPQSPTTTTTRPFPTLLQYPQRQPGAPQEVEDAEPETTDPTAPGAPGAAPGARPDAFGVPAQFPQLQPVQQPLGTDVGTQPETTGSPELPQAPMPTAPQTVTRPGLVVTPPQQQTPPNPYAVPGMLPPGSYPQTVPPRPNQPPPRPPGA